MRTEFEPSRQRSALLAMLGAGVLACTLFGRGNAGDESTTASTVCEGAQIVHVEPGATLPGLILDNVNLERGLDTSQELVRIAAAVANGYAPDAKIYVSATNSVPRDEAPEAGSVMTLPTECYTTMR